MLTNPGGGRRAQRWRRTWRASWRRDVERAPEHTDEERAREPKSEWRKREWESREIESVERVRECVEGWREWKSERERHTNGFWFSEHCYPKCPCHVKFNDQSTHVSNGGGGGGKKPPCSKQNNSVSNIYYNWFIIIW